MSLPISVTAEEWFRTGRIGGLSIGCTVEDVTGVFGVPNNPSSMSNPDGFPSFWLYDDIEFGFNSRRIALSIHACLLFETEEFIRMDWQGIAKEMLLVDVQSWLENKAFRFAERSYQYGTDLNVETQVQMAFEVPGAKMLNDENRKQLALTSIYAPPLKLGERLNYD